MRQVFWFFILFVTFAAHVWAEDAFDVGNQLYEAGRYEEAQASYETFVAERPVSEGYYNLGNAYFKTNSLGLAILNYERARELSPRNRDVRLNLKYASDLIEYEIEDKRSWHLKLMSALLARITFAESALVTGSVYLVFMLICLASFVLKRERIMGRWAITFLSVSLVLGTFTLLNYTNLGARQQAIVTAPLAQVRYGPSTSDRLAFRLTNGLKASVKGERSGWYRVQLLDGQTGWVSATEMTVI